MVGSVVRLSRRLRRAPRIGAPLIVACVMAAGCGEGANGVPPDPPLLILTAASLPGGTVSESYDLSLAASGGTGRYSWSVVNGALPGGLTLSPDGRLFGSPTTVEMRSFTIRVTSGSQLRANEFVLPVAPAPMVITTAILPDATLGASYTHFLNVEGGEGIVAWSVVSGTLPPGLQLSSAGIVVGNPSALGGFSFRVRAVRGALSAERSFVMGVLAPPLEVTTVSLTSAKVGEPYAAQLESRGGSGGNSWSLAEASVPSGLALAPSGAITGTPTAAGTVAFTVAVTSGAQRATRALSLAVDSAGYPSTAVVTMPANAFVPFLTRIARDGVVTWRFGADPHNAIFVATPGAPADINIVSNTEVSRTFPTLGSFRYDCTIHPGMTGIIEVKP